MDNIELYQSFKTLAARTWNEYIIKIKDSDDFGNKELNYNYN